MRTHTLLILLCGQWACRAMRVRGETLTVRRVIEGVSPTTAYDSCLCGWRDANFHLPIPPPLTLARGDEVSGLGFRLMRVPPFLVERCTEASYPYSMVYGVANPGPLTYPVSRHLGRISFEERRDGTLFTWHVEWVPLRGCGWFVSPLTRWVVEAAAAFTIAESERRRDGKSRYRDRASSRGRAESTRTTNPPPSRAHSIWRGVAAISLSNAFGKSSDPS